jgi:hypothetical protein
MKPDPSYTFETDIDDVEVTVTYYAEYQRGRFSGPPEDCYPDDSSMEIQSIKLGDGTELKEEMLTDRQRDALEDKCWQDYHAMTEEGPDYEPKDDYYEAY